MTVVPDTTGKPLFTIDGREAFLRGVIGAAVLLGIVAAAGAWIFETGFYDGLTIHPFWIVILIATMQHGAGVGVATVAMATLLMGWPDRLVGEEAAVYASRVAVLPLQWLVVALIVGLYRQRHLADTDTLHAEVATLRDMSASLAAEVARMDNMVLTLERNAAARPSPVPAPVQKDCSAGALLRRALPELSALAGARGAEIPAAFETVAAALFDGQVGLIASAPMQEALVIGGVPFAHHAPEQVAEILVAALAADKSDDTVSLRDVGLAETGAARVSRRKGHVEDGLSVTVIFFADDAASADAGAERVEIVAEMARIAIDRLGQDLGLGEDRPSALRAHGH